MSEKRLTDYTLAEVQATCSKFAKQHEVGILQWRCEVCPFSDVGGNTCLWRQNPFSWKCALFTPAEFDLMRRTGARYITMSDMKSDISKDVVELWDERQRPSMNERGIFLAPRYDAPLLRTDSRLFPSIHPGEFWDVEALLAEMDGGGAGGAQGH